MSPVKIYLTASCPYCIQAKQLLKQRGVAEIEEIRVDLQPDERRKMMEITGRRTVPQIFIGTTHVGGCDDLVALDQRGGLVIFIGQTHVGGCDDLMALDGRGGLLPLLAAG